MKKFLRNRKKVTTLLGILTLIVFSQALVIAKLWSGKTDKNYEVNLVKINTQKDSIDFLKIKNDLALVDHTIGDLNSFLSSKNFVESSEIFSW